MKRQLFAYLRRHGLAATVIKTFLWGGVFIQKNLFLTLNRGRRQVFDKIYEKNYWANEESVSGRGSEMNQTENIRRELPKIFERYNCLSVFDAPCGDYNWMLHVVEKTKIRYVGGDIVESLVRRNNEQHQNANASFITLDICKDELPDADIMICRDCLFHLSYSDIEAFINNFVASNIPLLLVTSHKRILEQVIFVCLICSASLSTSPMMCSIASTIIKPLNRPGKCAFSAVIKLLH
jgi:hypothetical protein